MNKGHQVSTVKEFEMYKHYKSESENILNNKVNFTSNCIHDFIFEISEEKFVAQRTNLFTGQFT